MTLTPAAKKIRAKRARRPVYLMVRRLMDPDTGEMVGALVPANEIDQRLLRERRFVVGKEIRAELKQSRNPAFHRLVHAVGYLLVDHVDGFESMTAHDAVKEVQKRAGVFCEPMEFELGQFGKVEVQVPRSIAFDEMDEGEFHEFFRGLTDYIDRHLLAGLSDAVRGDYLLMTGGGEQPRRVA